MYKDLFHSTVFTKKTIPGISFIYKEFRGFLALKVLKMRKYNISIIARSCVKCKCFFLLIILCRNLFGFYDELHAAACLL